MGDVHGKGTSVGGDEDTEGAEESGRLPLRQPESSQELPGGMSVPKEPFVQYTLPTQMLSMKWKHSGRPESERTFGMTELTTGRQKKASKHAGGMDIVGMLHAQQMLCIYHIGGNRTLGNFDSIESWKDAIGPRAWQMVEHAYNKLNTADDTMCEDFAKTGEFVDVNE